MLPSLSNQISPRKHQRRSYLNTAGDTVAYSSIKTTPSPPPLHADVPQETSKNQRAAILKIHLE